jgi:hypothetical protein
MRNEDELRALWQAEAGGPIHLTPDQLRARAERFESQTRRRYIGDQLSFAVVAIAFAFGMFVLDGLLARLGSAMLCAWALYGMYALHRFAAVLRTPAGAGADTCAAFHRRQLQRQRAYVLSWPLGFSLAAPGFVLLAAGYSLGPRQLAVEISMALVGVFVFVCLLTIIYGRTLGRRWQREIDELDAQMENAG